MFRHTASSAALLLLIPALLLPAASSAEKAADNAAEGNRDGFYMGMSGLAGIDVSESDTQYDTDNTGGIQVIAGMRWGRSGWLGADLYFDYLVGPNDDNVGQQFAFGLKAKLYLPKKWLNLGAFDPYGDLGMGLLNVKSTRGRHDWGGGWIGGGGVDYYINEKWVLNAAAEYRGGTGTFKDQVDTVLVGLGVRYRLF